MNPNEMKTANWNNFILATLTLAGVLTASEISLAQGIHQMAQITQPIQSEPASPAIPSGREKGPAESMPGGTRPTTPAPEPARPDSEAQKAGATPALPPAPAEKMGEPIQK